jgi:hypothetical protein
MSWRSRSVSSALARVDGLNGVRAREELIIGDHLARGVPRQLIILDERSPFHAAVPQLASANDRSSYPLARSWSKVFFVRFDGNCCSVSGSFVHKSIIAGCRCFASSLTSGPHQEGTP